MKPPLRFLPGKIIVCTSIGTITLDVRWLRQILAEYERVAEQMRRQENERREA